MSLAPESRDLKLRREWISPKLVGVAIGAVALVWSTRMFVGGWEANHAEHHEPRTFPAVATATRHVMPDAVSWQVTVTTHAADRRTAIHQLIDAVAHARAELIADGIEPTELTLHPQASDVDSETITKHHADGTEESEEHPHGFVATEMLEIRALDVRRVLAAYSAINSLEQPTLAVAEPACTLAGIAGVNEELADRARADVRARGEAAVAAIGGARLGKLVTAQVNSNIAGTRTQLALCSEGEDVVAVANATYELE